MLPNSSTADATRTTRVTGITGATGATSTASATGVTGAAISSDQLASYTGTFTPRRALGTWGPVWDCVLAEPHRIPTAPGPRRRPKTSQNSGRKFPSRDPHIYPF